MSRTIHTFSLFKDEEIGVPIPECAREYINPNNPTLQSVADAMVYQVVKFMDRNPEKDWREIVPPQWIEYVSWRLNE